MYTIATVPRHATKAMKTNMSQNHEGICAAQTSKPGGARGGGAAGGQTMSGGRGGSGGGAGGRAGGWGGKIGGPRGGGASGVPRKAAATASTRSVIRFCVFTLLPPWDDCLLACFAILHSFRCYRSHIPDDNSCRPYSRCNCSKETQNPAV